MSSWFAPRRLTPRATDTGAALLFALVIIKDAPQALLPVVDVSTDGRCNGGPSLQSTRNKLVGEGITVNGLAILNEDPNLVSYFS